MFREKIIREVIQSHRHLLGENAAAFLGRVYEKGIDIYTRRIAAYGFEGLGTVLDGGCGFGQWSLALSMTNDQVYSVDVSEERVQVLNTLIDKMRIENVIASVASLSNLEFEDNSFHGIFCYGVIFLTRWKESLSELSRVLRPAGKIYVNANGFGWYKNLWFNEPNKTLDYDPRLHVAKSFCNTWKYHNGRPTELGVDILVEPDELIAQLTDLGFIDICMDAEGCLRVEGHRGDDVTPFFEGEYMGDMGVYEIIAKKG